MLGSRRRARELALQLLYFRDLQSELSPDEVARRYFASFAGAEQEEDGRVERDDDARRYAERLLRGVAEHQAEIDERISRASKNWRLERMARVDRNLIRLGAYEMLFAGGEVPAKVAINEGIEIAKRFGSHDSAAFVNGILDRILDDSRGKG